jgi:hypothetical protein
VATRASDRRRGGFSRPPWAAPHTAFRAAVGARGASEDEHTGPEKGDAYLAGGTKVRKWAVARGVECWTRAAHVGERMSRAVQHVESREETCNICDNEQFITAARPNFSPPVLSSLPSSRQAHFPSARTSLAGRTQ